MNEHPPQPPPLSPQPPASRARIQDSAIAGIALLLPLATLLLFRNGDTAVVVALIMAPVCSLAGGVWLGIRLGKTSGARVLRALLLPVVLLFCSEALLALGCSFGNVNVNFH